MYELIIIGGGPAAITAAIYAARKKIKTLILAKSFGGQMLESYLIDNYPGLPALPGVKLMEKFVEHLKQYEKATSKGDFDLAMKEGEAAQSISQESQTFLLKTDRAAYSARAVIIATGKTERKLEIPGAADFEGKGITYCATCDAPIFRDKVVAVIGGGDSGQDTALQLLDYASKIYILSRYEDLKGSNRELQEKLKNNPKIEILKETEPKEIFGEKFVKGMICKNLKSREEKKIEVSGIFVEIGSIPSANFIDGLIKRNEKGEIIVDHNSGATSCFGIFAAGDVTDISAKQIVVAAGEG
ncbi:MAG: FAD-dependent oxidoreductase, partial [Candidatus Portnoybacteria bacterium]|nr:FAD-dependent oxidoreductase [Candidatus Portnoybacteria bacterium]